MITHDTDDLRRALAEQAENAPEGPDMLAAVMAAAPARRRLRAFQAAALVAAVTASAIVVPLVLDGSDQPAQPRPSAPTTAAAPVRPVILPAGVAPDSEYGILEDGFVGTTQHMEIRGPSAGGSVAVFAPGTFDPEPYRHGEPVTVNGLPGHYVAQDAVDAGDMPHWSGTRQVPFTSRLVWQALDDRWLVYTTRGEQSVESMLRGAETVSMTEPHELLVPVAIPDPPAGMRVEAAHLAGNDISLTYVAGGLPPSTPDSVVYDFESGSTSGFVLVVHPRPGLEQSIPRGVPPVRAGEADTWYGENPGESTVVFGPGQSGTVFATDTCVGSIQAKDTREMPKAAVEAFIAGIDFRDCKDYATWAPLER